MKLYQEEIKKIKSLNTNIQYTILKDHKLGQGSFGTVYKAFNSNNMNQKVVIKEIDFQNQSQKQTIENEIKVVQDLPRHCNLVLPQPIKIYSQKHYFILMKYCRSGNLKQEMKNKKYSEQQIYYIFYELIRGYEVLFNHDILHLDIKPQNVLIHEGRYMLSDFGLSSPLNSNQANQIKGTTKFMCPQIRDRNYKGSNKTDVYALGVLFYMMIYKKHPYLQSDVNLSKREAMAKIKSNPIRKPSNISQFSIKFNDFLDILIGMLQKNPKDRLSFPQLLNLIQQVPQVKISHSTLSQSLPIINLKQVQNQDVMVINSNTDEEEEKKIVEKTKNTNMQNLISKLKQQVKTQTLVSDILVWVQSHRNLIFYFDKITIKLHKQWQFNQSQQVRNCIYCGILLMQQISQIMINQIQSGSKKFSKAHWKIFQQSQSFVIPVIYKDRLNIKAQKQQIIEKNTHKFQTAFKYCLKKQLLNTQDKLKTYFKRFKMIFQHNKTIVQSILILKMIEITQNYEQAIKLSESLNTFYIEVCTNQWKKNVDLLINLAVKVNVANEIMGIDFTNQLFDTENNIDTNA